jgi:hypothetical protein
VRTDRITRTGDYLVEHSTINIRGYSVIVSVQDIQKIMLVKWTPCPGGRGKTRGLYFKGSVNGKNEYLHRYITNCPLDKVVDHINGNTLDNRQENLRICTRAENCRNIKRSGKYTNPYKGVYYNKQNKRWRAQIKVNSEKIYLGIFISPEEARDAYIAAAKKYHGEFASF